MTVGLSLMLAASLAAQSANPEPAALATASAEITVLTYNVHGLPWPLSPGRAARLRQIGEELGKMRRNGRAPDVVLIQEGFSGGMRDLIRLSGYRYWARGPRRHDRAGEGAGRPRVRYRQAGEGWGKFTSSGLYVLSDHPLSDVEAWPYTACAGWDCLANKGAMLAHIALDGVPGGIEVANTHLNSRRAARVPVAWSLQAYNRQVSQFDDFLARGRERAVPLLVGGDFNVRRAPDRYAQVVAAKAFSVVSEYCLAAGSGCEPTAAPATPSPWLETQDLQAFSSAGPVTVQPMAARPAFDNRDAPRLSDHDGYLVRYRLTWNDGDGQTRLSAPLTSTTPAALEGVQALSLRRGL